MDFAKDFITRPLAVQLKGLRYPNDCVPSWLEAFRFLREIYGLYAEILVDQTMEPKFTYEIAQYRYDYTWADRVIANHIYYTYEEAQHACLVKLIEVAKNNVSNLVANA